MLLSNIFYTLSSVALVAGMPGLVEKKATSSDSPVYYNYPGVGEWAKDAYWYSQAVRVGDMIHVSGQGGWKPNGQIGNVSTDLSTEIAQAFSNVDLALRTAGGKGWSEVYKVNSYHLPLNTEGLVAMVDNMKKYMPDAQPVWSMFGVQRLAQDAMHVEIEVEAYSPRS